MARFAALAAVLVIAGCTGAGSEGDGDAGTAGTADTESEETTTTTAAPILYGLVPNLALGPEQCWAELPETTTTTTAATTTSTTGDDGATTTTTEDTIPETLPPTATTVPQAPLLAVVDCAGTHAGQAFDTFCLAPGYDADGEPTGELISTLCGGVDDGLEWPGDRTVRRAASRICLQRFAEHFGEGYEDSPRVAREFTPTEGIWERGERRVVCTVDALEDDLAEG